MEFDFRRAVEILGRTYPFVLLRLGVYVLVFIVGALWWIGIFLLFQNWPFPGPAWLAWIFGAVLFGSSAKVIRLYALYLLKAAHVSVITQLALYGELPEGRNQLEYGKDLVLRYFMRITVLFAVDRLVRVVLRAFNRSVFGMLKAIPGLGAFRDFAQRVLDYSVGYVDEAIFSYSLLHPEESPWKSARDGLLLYAQNWKTILGSGAILAALSYVLVAVVAAPGILLSLGLGGPFRQIGIGASIAVGLLVKFALMDPFALTTIIVNFHKAIEGQTPDPAWEKSLEQASSRFREIREKAAEWRPAEPVPPPPPAP